MKQKPRKEEPQRLRFLGYSLLTLIVLAYASLSVFHVSLASLLAAATSTVSAPATVYFTPYDDETTLEVGASEQIDLNINARTPINAVGMTISYPKDLLEIVSIDKSRSFLDLWTEDTVIKEGSGELHFSGGTTKAGGLAGTSTVLTIAVRAKKEGSAEVTVEHPQVLAADGKGTALDTDTRTLTFAIEQGHPGSAAAAPSPGALAAPKSPSADFNGDGKVSLIDMSILIIKMMSPYDPRYDLNLDGQVGLGDLSVLFARIGGSY